MKKVLLFCLVQLILLFAIAPGSAASDTSLSVTGRREDLPGEEIRQQLTLAGLTLEQIHMSGWAKANDSFMSLPALERFAVESIRVAGNDYEADILSEETEKIRQVKLQIGQDGVYCLILFRNEEYNGSDECETYVIAEAVLQDVKNQDESKIYGEIKDFLSRFAADPCIRTTYIATLPGQMDTDRMDGAGRQIFFGLQGKVTEKAQDGGWVSMTGYSSKIGCAMDSNGKWINLNVALRYNQYDDKTYVWLGTPIISIPY